MRVSKDELARIKRRTIAQCHPSRGNDLLGMIIDIEHFVGDVLGLEALKVRKTGDKESMLDARCKVASSELSLNEVASQIERIWLQDLCYQNFEAHSLVKSDNAVVLDFVTIMGSEDLFVTGRISVELQDT